MPEHDEMPDMSIEELFRYLSSLHEGETLCGASKLPCGHWFVFLRLHGTTVMLHPHCSEEQANRIGDAALVLIEAIEAVYTERTGEVPVDTRQLFIDLAHIMRDALGMPPSPDA